MDDTKQHRSDAQERAYRLGKRDTYKNFPRVSHDLERRMMCDWILETQLDEVSWLDVRDAAVQGWEERQEEIAAHLPREESFEEAQADLRRRQAILQLARSFGASEPYRHFPTWGDDLEQRIQRDWEALFGDTGLPGWVEIRETVKAGWLDEHARNVPGAPLGYATFPAHFR